MRITRFRPIALAAAAVVSASAAALAEPAVAITTPVAGLQQLFRFDTASPGALALPVPITGTTAAEAIADIDLYPVTGQLFGIGATSGTLYRIDRFTGAATVDQVPSASVGAPRDIDFNPAADRLRVASAGNQNFRVTPSTFNNAGLVAGAVSDDGVFAFAAGDVSAGATPNLVGNAYTNSFDGATGTTLFSLDTTTNSLLMNSGGPQFSTLNTVAALTSGGAPLDLGDLVGFDITPSGSAFVSNGNALFTLNLGSGQLTPLGNLPAAFGVQSLAVVPEPGFAGAAAAALLAAARRRRR